MISKLPYNHQNLSERLKVVFKFQTVNLFNLTLIQLLFKEIVYVSNKLLSNFFNLDIKRQSQFSQLSEVKYFQTFKFIEVLVFNFLSYALLYIQIQSNEYVYNFMLRLYNLNQTLIFQKMKLIAFYPNFICILLLIYMYLYSTSIIFNK